MSDGVGPLLVDGPLDVVLPDGTRVRSERPVVALCGCRRSRRYPFCDASHRGRGLGGVTSGRAMTSLDPGSRATGGAAAVAVSQEVVMPAGSSAKRQRQYEDIKDSERERGESTERAEEIAARTVNRERAPHGGSRTASSTSTKGMSSPRRGGRRSHGGAQGPTYDQLYQEAKRRNIDGRSKMNKRELASALGH
jgi:CDGSH-type Zn-finger protein